MQQTSVLACVCYSLKTRLSGNTRVTCNLKLKQCVFHVQSLYRVSLRFLARIRMECAENVKFMHVICIRCHDPTGVIHPFILNGKGYSIQTLYVEYALLKLWVVRNSRTSWQPRLQWVMIPVDAAATTDRQLWMRRWHERVTAPILLNSTCPFEV